MLNIENYEQWAKVCDDDDLILDLYNQGIRPGTDEFVKLLGKPYDGEPATSKDQLIVYGGIALTAGIVIGGYKLGKFAVKKVKQSITKHFAKSEES